MSSFNIDQSISASGRVHAYAADIGEPVFVTPCHNGANGRSVLFEDGAFASYASFGWSSSNVILARGAHGTLRYKKYRQMARFAGASMPRDLRPGYRITRTWDGVILTVVSVHRRHDHLECELVEVADRTLS